MKQYGNKILVCVLVVILLCGCAGQGNKSAGNPESTGQDMQENQEIQENQDQTPGEEEGPMPVVFEGKDMEGNVVTSDVFSETKLTMVNVWATYCNPCLSEMPHLGELAGEYDEDTFQLIGIISDVLEEDAPEVLENAEGLIAQTGADYTHLLLNLSLYNGLLTDVTAVPTTFFVNQEGIVVETVVGARDKKAWKEIIDGLLEEQ